mgnify:FL=1|jgi:hypothetical protein
MANLKTKVELYLKANSKTWNRDKVSLQDNSDGNGAFIASWSYDIAEPTAEQLATYETAANIEEALQIVLDNRRNDYPSIADQLDDIYHNGIDAWKATIKITKDKYPK